MTLAPDRIGAYLVLWLLAKGRVRHNLPVKPASNILKPYQNVVRAFNYLVNNGLITAYPFDLAFLVGLVSVTVGKRMQQGHLQKLIGEPSVSLTKRNNKLPLLRFCITFHVLPLSFSISLKFSEPSVHKIKLFGWSWLLRVP